jgi:hypothetical protein
MKPLAATAMIAVFYAGVSMAQMQGEKPAASANEPAGIALITGNESKHAREADARHCLEQKDNLAIIRCAEKYRRMPTAKAGGA